MGTELLTLLGTVENVIYKNVSNGYIVLEIVSDNELICVVGNLGEIAEGEKLLLTGDYIMTQKYGRQFKAETCERTPPETTDEIRRYLSSGIIKGLGPSLAKKITDVFGEDSLHVIENEPMKLASVNGINADRAAYIGEEYKRICSVKNVVDFLSEYGFSPQTAVLVWQKYENAAVQMLKENPYILCEFGIDADFEAVDKIASAFSIDSCDKNRVSAAISFILRENSVNGHTCLPLDALRTNVCETFNISLDAFDITLYENIDSGLFGNLTAKDKSRIYLSNYYQAEMFIADKLSKMLLKNDNQNSDDFSEEITIIESTEGIKYEALQKEAINGCLSNNLFILTGGPGTGKTTTLNAVIKILRKQRLTLSLAAPTGRAAKRIADLTGESAKTIHRLLEVNVTNDNLLSFKRNESNPLKADAVIIDEVSMVDVLLFDALLRALKPNCKLILVGDSNQLPPVGAGNVLKDLIGTELVPAVELKEIFRQAAESLIVTSAHKIIKGEMPELKIRNKDFFFMDSHSDEDIAGLTIDLIKNRLPKTYNYNPFEDIQVLSPTKLGPAGTKELNKALQLALNPPAVGRKEIRFYDVVFRVGDKIMQISNDYEVEWRKGGEKGTGIFNGDIGIITEIDPHSGNLRIDFEGRMAIYTSNLINKIEHAYAVTIHKSQGSEYNAVVIPLTARSKQLLYRNLLYTGVTRAKNILIIIGAENVVKLMVDSNRNAKRYSSIKPVLISKYKKLTENHGK